MAFSAVSLQLFLTGPPPGSAAAPASSAPPAPSSGVSVSGPLPSSVSRPSSRPPMRHRRDFLSCCISCSSASSSRTRSWQPSAPESRCSRRSNSCSTAAHSRSAPSRRPRSAATAPRSDETTPLRRSFSSSAGRGSARSTLPGLANRKPSSYLRGSGLNMTLGKECTVLRRSVFSLRTLSSSRVLSSSTRAVRLST
ncbi:hypothetical protein EYF80_006363 [Liparis tanakae]|uniref:Uncharacterized protein n=1 Tax=Liparis tanakae TaxID=230148 RepID=A0A4Z2J1J3_9TELE|nr:hypothetical protein EYF80_006363 [Liparis tanakae]